MKITINTIDDVYDFIHSQEVDIYILNERFIRAGKTCPKCGDIMLFGNIGYFSEDFFEENSINDIFVIIENEGNECMNYDDTNFCSCKEIETDYGDSYDVDDQIDIDDEEEY